MLGLGLEGSLRGGACGLSFCNVAWRDPCGTWDGVLTLEFGLES